MKVFPSSYLAPIAQFALYLKYKQVSLESNENFIKQSYRNRCYIYGANGPLMLNIPLMKVHAERSIKDKKISYDMDWQTLHWRSLEACYRSSPYFEYYEEELQGLYIDKKTVYLLDFNEMLEERIKDMLKLDYFKVKTESYERLSEEKDFRQLIHPKNDFMKNSFAFPKYIQVFENKYGFIPNLSIIDLLFNEGPQAKNYLEKVEILNEF